MKNIIVCNLVSERHFRHYKQYVSAQIDNSLLLGWRKEDIILVTNFQYSYKGIKPNIFELDCDFCLTGSKVFAMLKLFEAGLIDGNAWLHDLDVWQISKFEFPEDLLEMGMTRYIGRWQGGSVLLRPSSRDIFEKITTAIKDIKSHKEEPVIKKVLKIKEYGDRVARIDDSYNVGATGFERRYSNSQKPIKALHMHPHRSGDCKRNIVGMNRLGVRTANGNLLGVFSKHFGISPKSIEDASVAIKVDSDHNIEDLSCGAKLHTNRKFSFTDIAEVLKGRKFLVLPHKKSVLIDVVVTSPGALEIGLCDEHEEIIASFKKEYYEMERIPLKTNYRDAKKIRLFRKFFAKGEILKLKHEWRVNPIIIANKITNL